MTFPFNFFLLDWIRHEWLDEEQLTITDPIHSHRLFATAGSACLILPPLPLCALEDRILLGCITPNKLLPTTSSVFLLLSFSWFTGLMHAFVLVCAFVWHYVLLYAAFALCLLLFSPFSQPLTVIGFPIQPGDWATGLQISISAFSATCPRWNSQSRPASSRISASWPGQIEMADDIIPNPLYSDYPYSGSPSQKERTSRAGINFLRGLSIDSNGNVWCKTRKKRYFW